jgi:hypothetical protein
VGHNENDFVTHSVLGEALDAFQDRLRAIIEEAVEKALAKSPRL